MIKLNNSDNEILKEVSRRLGIIPEKLFSIIYFESQFDPKISNPYSSAKGLLQFTDIAAKGLSFKNSEDLIKKLPTIKLQLINAVYPYLKKYKPFKSDQDLFMAVFYPASRFWHPDQQFPKSVQSVNFGIKTPRDYIKKVYSFLPSYKKNKIILYGIIGSLIILTIGGIRGKN